jgi:hypothetical protein
VRRVWLGEDFEVTGSMVSTWRQSWAVSRNERTGRWTVYDRRDDRPFEGRDGGSWIQSQRFATAEEALPMLLDKDNGFEPVELLAVIREMHDPRLDDLETALLRHIEPGSR